MPASSIRRASVSEDLPHTGTPVGERSSMRADLQGILREVATASDLDEALAIIVRRIKGALPVDFCAVYLTDTASDQPVRVPTTGSDPALPRPFSASRQAELLSLVVERRELVVLT